MTYYLPVIVLFPIAAFFIGRHLYRQNTRSSRFVAHLLVATFVFLAALIAFAVLTAPGRPS